MKQKVLSDLQSSMMAACSNPNLSSEDVASIIQDVQHIFDLDKIVVLTNREYKYQLDHELTCTADGVVLREPFSYALSAAEYEESVRLYDHQQTSERMLDSLGPRARLLHAGMVRDGELFGVIVFRSEKKDLWTEEEKKALEELCHLYFLYLSLNNLVHGYNTYKNALERFRRPNVVSGFFVNLLTKKIRAMKLPEGMKSLFPEWGDYDMLLQLYSQKFVEGFYKEKLLHEAGFDTVKLNLTKDEPVLTTEFPRYYKGKLGWMRYEIRGMHFDEEGYPSMAIAAFMDITDEVKDNAYLFGASNFRKRMYTTVIALDLNTEQYAVCIDNRDKEHVSSGFGLFGHYSEICKEVLQATTNVEKTSVKKLLDVKYLIRYFDNYEEPLQVEFPYEVNSSLFWLRFTIIKAYDYQENHRRVMLYYSDITSEKQAQLALETENAKKKYQLEHDPLTGVYNRHGLEEVIKEIKDKKQPVAYLQVDVDAFKNINDTYGHGFGDEVLQVVANRLEEAFRSEDYVFRFGGDEFAVLLMNYRNVSWEDIGDKLRKIHMQMNQILKKSTYFTLSVGVCWSETGFSEGMISVADAALYRTKSNGRAGCCILDKESRTLYEWKDEIQECKEGNAFEQSETGACRVEFPDGDLSQARLICNETARAIMGLTEAMTPEECYQTWRSRVEPYYLKTITNIYTVMLEKGRAECKYLYHHPVMGTIMVRSGGRCLKNKEGVLLYGYHQLIQNTSVVLQEDDSQKLIQAMMGLYFASYYINLEEDWYCIFKSTEEAKTFEKQDVPTSVLLQDFVKNLVKPESQDVMASFLDLSTVGDRLQEREYLECEYQSAVADKGWCRSRILVVRRNETGKPTHVQLLFASIDQEKRERLQQEAVTATIRKS